MMTQQQVWSLYRLEWWQDRTRTWLPLTGQGFDSLSEGVAARDAFVRFDPHGWYRLAAVYR